MKKIFTLFIFFFVFSHLQAASGIFDSFAIVNANGSGNTYYDLGASTANPDFQGAFLGTFDQSNHSLVLGGQLKSYKNNGTDVTGASLFYRIYPSGSSPSGTFTEIPYSFQIDNVNGTTGDQQWGTDIQGSHTTDTGVDILSGSTLTAGDYTLEVYAVIYTNGVDADPIIYDSRGGSNYQATFTITESLPVELTSFSANVIGNRINLKWQTATEVNNYGFEIERKNAGNNDWVKIGFVEGNGNSNSPKEYTFTDNSVNSGNYFYRLKQIDIDGSFEYSQAVEVSLGLPSEFSLSQNYPNPFNPTTTIKYSIPTSETLHATSQQLVQLKIYDILGREIATLVNKKQAPGNYEVRWNAENLPSGFYFYKLQTGEFTQTRKMILLK